MDRLTKKRINSNNDYSIYLKKDFTESLCQAIQKLGKLEDLEEQLGCPIDVVFKALNDGIYYGDNANWMMWVAVDLHINLEGEYVLYFSDEEYLLTKDYKKTWWLKEDRSE